MERVILVKRLRGLAVGFGMDREKAATISEESILHASSDGLLTAEEMERIIGEAKDVDDFFARADAALVEKEMGEKRVQRGQPKRLPGIVFDGRSRAEVLVSPSARPGTPKQMV